VGEEREKEKERDGDSYCYVLHCCYTVVSLLLQYVHEVSMPLTGEEEPQITAVIRAERKRAEKKSERERETLPIHLAILTLLTLL
jgi:hypothetical protein